MKVPTPENGATVKAMMKIEWNRYIILARWGDEWVIWRMDNEGNCYWGYYFTIDELEQAAEKFFNTCKIEMSNIKSLSPLE